MKTSKTVNRFSEAGDRNQTHLLNSEPYRVIINLILGVNAGLCHLIVLRESQMCQTLGLRILLFAVDGSSCFEANVAL